MRKQRNDSYDRSYDDDYIKPGHGEYHRREKYRKHWEHPNDDDDENFFDDDGYDHER